MYKSCCVHPTLKAVYWSCWNKAAATHTLQTSPSLSVLPHVTTAHFYTYWSTDLEEVKEFYESENFFYIFSVVLTTHFLSFPLPLFSFFLHGQFFCSRASGSTPTCPKRSVWSLPKVTRRSASPNSRQQQPLLTRL